ncbi:MAG: redox-regulated ATPase YchF [Deltaproteobacteria bacterium]|nr:redox-regulated ATPase YchF [Deltaproteobacteria bacterium]MCW5808597.1 redox-regulated ATPase YchF [Deltaproteobacteria bacterium]
MSVGIVGLPNVGKSTVFNALTAGKAEAANYPFCTIDPNVGVVPVPDPRLRRIQAKIATQKVIPAIVEIVDIAGLVKGASQGEGLGNKFLANIRETNAVLMMVRCFDDPNVIHVAGSVDPMRDIDVIDVELSLADLDSLEKRLKKAQGAAKTGAKEGKAELALVEKVHAHVAEGKPARALALGDDERALVNTWGLLTTKPVLYCCNVGETDLPNGNAWSDIVKARAVKEGAGVVILCGKVEAELAELAEDDRGELLASYNLTEPALATLARECYRLLGLQSYFTAGEKEIRAWTVKKGALAPEAAGVIHSDFEKNFIRAQVYGLGDLESYGSEGAIKAAGKLRVEGKEYVVQDGDIMYFL